MTLENLIGKGLQKEPAGKEELARFRSKIATKLADAQNSTLSLDTRFDVAYEALLQIGLAALIEETIALQQQFLQWLREKHPELL